MMCDEVDYKKFYDENRIALLQYQSLRNNFNKLVDEVLGEDYYNMAMDVFEADRICCEDIARECKKGFFSRFFSR